MNPFSSLGGLSAQALGALVAIVYLCLGLFHVYWAMGGQFGRGSAVPQLPSGDATPEGPVMVAAFTPSRSGTLLVAAALLGVATLVALRSGLFATPISHPALRMAVAAAALVMLARAVGDFRLVGFFKKVRHSAFARMDTLLYSPLCVLLGFSLALLA